jgi:UDP-glucose 4-epimerase
VRLFSVYGSSLKKQVLWDICARLESGSCQIELGGTGEELRDWTDIRDVVRVLELAMSLPADPDAIPIVNAGSGRATSISRIAQLVLESWPAPAWVRFNGRSRPGDPFSLVADSTFLHNVGFDWKIPVRSGICDYVRWYLQYSRSAA